MSWNSHYLPPSKNPWQGRADIPPASAFFQVMRLLDLLDNKPISAHAKAFALIGFKCDEGIRRNLGRPGAEDGPNAIRQALARLPIPNQHFVCFDAGTIVCADKNLEAAQEALANVIDLLLKEGLIPIVLGGGHELAWGHYQGIAAAYPQLNLGIVNFDAHFDMRPLNAQDKGSSGTPFLQIATAHQAAKRRFDYNCIGIQQAGNIRQLFETAEMHQAKIILADELHLGQLEKCTDFIDRIIDENEIIYLSLCLDVFAAAFAPGVSAIQPLGLSPWQVIPAIRHLAASGKVISYDIAELSPRYDIDHCTAKLAAHLIYEIIHHHNHL